VRAKVFRPARAAAVTIKAGHRLAATRLEVTSEDVTLCHGSQYPPAEIGKPLRAQPYWPTVGAKRAEQ
jgi:hypothetical protein